jgi:hypothetical protein
LRINRWEVTHFEDSGKETEWRFCDLNSQKRKKTGDGFSVFLFLSDGSCFFFCMWENECHTVVLVY